MIHPSVLRIGLPETGKIKIGMKGEERTGKNGKFQLPTKLDHFKVTTLNKDSSTGNFVVDEGVHKIIGEKPTEIKIRLLYNDIEANFQTGLACYAGKRVFCSGDGTTAMRASRSNGQWDFKTKVPQECVCPYLEQGSKTQCKPTGKLSCMIDGIETIGGAYVLRTTSWNTIQSILGSLTLIKSITGGELAGIPLYLTMQPKLVTTPEGSPVTAQIVSIVYKGSAESLRNHALLQATDRVKAKINIENVEQKLLASIVDSDINPEDEDYMKEFQPEQFSDEEEEVEPELAPSEKTAEKKEKITPKKSEKSVPTEKPKKKSSTLDPKKTEVSNTNASNKDSAQDADFDEVENGNISEGEDIEDDLDDSQEDPLLAAPDESEDDSQEGAEDDGESEKASENGPSEESDVDDDDDFDFDDD